MSRVLKIFTATQGLGSGPVVVEIDPADTRSPEEICASQIKDYKTQKSKEGDGYMSEPRWKQSLVRAGIFESEAEDAKPVLVLEYNHNSGTSRVSPDVFTNPRPTAALRLES